MDSDPKNTIDVNLFVNKKIKDDGGDSCSDIVRGEPKKNSFFNHEIRITKVSIIIIAFFVLLTIGFVAFLFYYSQGEIQSDWIDEMMQKILKF